MSKWLVDEVAARYQISRQTVEKIAKHFNLPLVGTGANQFILMYKPNVFEHPLTQKKSLQINLFEIKNLNEAMRACFMDAYQGKTWFWHRFVWRLPTFVLKGIESIYIMFASFFYSPKNAIAILGSKWNAYKASKKIPSFDSTRVNSCFTDADVKNLAQLIRRYYASSVWQKGDILLVDNKKVMHAGMPGSGPRLVRAMIANPLQMQYTAESTGTIECNERNGDTIGYYMTLGKLEACSELVRDEVGIT